MNEMRLITKQQFKDIQDDALRAGRIGYPEDVRYIFDSLPSISEVVPIAEALTQLYQMKVDESDEISQFDFEKIVNSVTKSRNILAKVKGEKE